MKSKRSAWAATPHYQGCTFHYVTVEGKERTSLDVSDERLRSFGIAACRTRTLLPNPAQSGSDTSEMSERLSVEPAPG